MLQEKIVQKHFIQSQVKKKKTYTDTFVVTTPSIRTCVLLDETAHRNHKSQPPLPPHTHSTRTSDAKVDVHRLLQILQFTKYAFTIQDKKVMLHYIIGD